MVFEFDDYKSLLRYLLDERKRNIKGFALHKLARACRIQKTYLSRVLNSTADLSEDQMYLASRELEMAKDEIEYLSLLHQRDRSGVKSRVDLLSKEIKQLRKNNKKSEKHIKVQPLKSNLIENTSIYYLDMNFQLVHILLTIERFVNNPSLITKILSIKKEKLQFYLDTLIELSLIEYHDGEYTVIKDSLHLSKDSPIFHTYRRLTRDHSLNKLEHLDGDDQYSFSVSFSTSPEVKNKIHQEFLEFLKKTKSWVDEGVESEVYQMNFDLFKWS